ncbi:MAG: TetR/AcrR family transcriptional regulator [Eubacteriales bacterium]|nr:TetR/AcrR family transcriptional regulator [Eubacteriales bacterium]
MPNGAMKWRQEGTQNPLAANRELLGAALGAFAAHSFQEASLNDILKAAGLNKGSFYYRFYDKLDLYLSLFQMLAEQKLALFQAYDDAGTGDDFYASIRQKALLGLRFAKKEPEYNALSRRFMGEDPAFRKTVTDAFGGVTENALRRMVEAAREKGQIRGDISVEMMTEVFSLLLERIDKVITPEMSDQEVLHKVDELITVLRDGTRAEPYPRG